MSSRALFVTPLLLLALIVPTGPVSGAEVDASTSSANLTPVANLPHRARFVDGAAAGDGSDIEFATIEVQVGVDADGHPIMEPRDFALAGTYNRGLQIIDITDPTQPKTTGVYDCVLQQGDVQVFTRQSRTYAAYTSDDGYGTANTNSQCFKEAKALGFRPSGTTNYGIFIADITNPASPTTVSFVHEPRGSHNTTVSPNGNYLYNSNSDLTRAATGQIEVFDISNLAQPVKKFTLETVSGLSAHDITFNVDGTRAYAAAIAHTLVLDTSNLAEPKVIGRIVDPAINIHHQSDPVTMKDATTGLERTFLVITDELAGAGGNGVCPGGGLHVYDVTGPLEQAPVKVGIWNSPGVRRAEGNLTCTSHVLRFYPQHKLMTIAWYEAGVRVVDISGLMGVSAGASETEGNVGVGMKEIGFAYFDNSDTWSAKTNRIEADGSFYLYGNDLSRGLDVYRFNASAPATANPGTWLSPSEAPKVAASSGRLEPRCMYLAKGLTVG